MEDIQTIYLEQNINKDEFNWKHAADAIYHSGIADGFTVVHMEFEDESVLVTYIDFYDSEDYVRFKQA